MHHKHSAQVPGSIPYTGAQWHKASTGRLHLFIFIALFKPLLTYTNIACVLGDIAGSSLVYGAAPVTGLC